MAQVNVRLRREIAVASIITIVMVLAIGTKRANGALLQLR
jgi:hypothetical protein